VSNARAFLEQLVHELTYEEARRTPPGPTQPLGPARLCIGMSTYDDFDGVFFTIQALRMMHPEVLEDTSFLIIDNHPEAAAAESLRQLAAKVPNCGYLPFRGYRSTQVRDLVFREANADIVLCVDSHILVLPGALRALLDYFQRNPESLDIVQGPLVDETLSNVVGTHFTPGWNQGMWGQWGIDERVDNPTGESFEIPMQGLGLFACRRAAWPGVNPRFRSFGGEEGYLHEKFRRNGGRAICLPALRWTHRFERPRGIPYDIDWESRVRNYLFGWAEMRWDTPEVEAHFTEYLGSAAVTPLQRAKRQVESPFSFFDAVLCTAEDEQWPAMLDRFRQLDIAWRVERVPSLLAAVEIARRRGYESVLVIDGEVSFIEDTVALLGETVAPLATERWDVLALDAAHHAVALHREAIEALAALPRADEDAFVVAFTEALASGEHRVVRTTPRVATHPSLLATEDALLAARYVL
jgi:hypothetical protein